MIKVPVVARLWRVVLLSALMLAALPVASALATTTIGQAAASAGTAGQCGTGVFGDATYKVPAGGGVIRSMSIYSSSASAGEQRDLLVLRGSGSSYKVVGKTGLITLFGLGIVQSVPTDIAVQAGDILGVYVAGARFAFHQECGRAVASGGGSISGVLEADPNVGDTLPALRFPTPSPTFNLNVSAELGLPSQTISFGALSNKTYDSPSFTLTATGGGSGNPVTYALGAGSVGCSLSGANNATVSITGVTGAGETCTIVASQAAGEVCQGFGLFKICNATYEAATSVTRAFTIAKGSQTISFGALSNKTYDSASFTLTATGGSSGNPVRYELGAGSVGCSLSGANNATVSITSVTGVGETCSIVASQAGNANYEAASSVTRDFTIAKASQAISFGALSTKTYGAASFTLNATGGNSGNPVTYELGSGSVGCSLSGINDATVTITGASGTGTCSVVASQAGNTNYEAAVGVTRDFTIAKAELTVTADDQTMTYAGTVPQLTYQIAGFVNGEALATSGVTGTPGLSTTATSGSGAANYAITVAAGQLASANYSFRLVTGTLAVAKRQASVEYTGANYTAIAAAGNATINVSAKVSRTGSLGDLALARVEFVVKRFGGGVQTTVFAMADASGNAATTASVPNSDDPYTIEVRVDPANAYWTSGVDVAPLQVIVGSGTGRTAGAGRISDTSNTLNGKSTFGFNVQNAKGGIKGNSLFVYRALEGGNQVQYVVKSNSWQRGGLTFNVNTDPTRATFTGKATVQRYVNGVVDASFSGGNHTFTVDAFDGDLLNPKQRDGYAITVRNSANAIVKQLGTRTNPVPLGGGNVLIQSA